MNAAKVLLHIDICMDSFTEHGCLPAFLLLLGGGKIITTQSLPEMPSWPSLPISTYHLFHKAFTNVDFFQWRVGEASKVMSLKVLESNQREVFNISCWVGLDGHWDHALIHPFIYVFMHSYSFILSFNNSLWNANYKHHSTRYWGYNGDQGWQVLCFYETDGRGGETDIKSIMYISNDTNPNRCCDGEAFVSLWILNSCAILARASWKAPWKVTCLLVWLDTWITGEQRRWFKVILERWARDT